MNGTKRVMVSWLMLTVGVFGQATFPSPTLSSISPLGGQRGTELELTLKGTHLDGPVDLLFSPEMAVKTRPKLDAKGQPLANQWLVTIPAEARSGAYELRVVGRYGVSNPRVFQISALPQAMASGANIKSEAAQKVALDHVIMGVFKTAAPHWWAFPGKAGQRVLGVFKGEAFDTKMTLTGALLDEKGREVGKLRDGLLDVRLPMEGLYRLKIHDLMFGAGDDYGYRLTLTTGPVVWAAGQGVVYGWNLPGGQVMSGVKVGPSTALEKVEGAAPALGDLVANSPLAVLDLSLENERADAAWDGKPTAMTVGQTVGGWFPSAGAARVFDLAFKAGERFVVELESSELGLPTDPVLLIENVKAQPDGSQALTVQAEVLDPAGLVPAPAVPMLLRDPSYAFEAKADGVFRLSVSDPLNAANGQRYPFVLRVKPLQEASMTAALALHPTLPKAAVTGPYEVASANLWRGGVTAIEVVLPLRTALSEPLELKVAGLPAGVTCLSGWVGKNQRVGYLALSASADTPAGAALLTGLGKTRHLNWPVRDGNRERLFSRVGGQPALGVVAEKAPARVEVEAGRVFEVEAGGKLEIPVKVMREAAFTEALTLKPLGLVDLTKAPSVAVAAKTAEGKLTVDTKALALAVGEYGFLLQGSAKMPFRPNSGEIAAAAEAAKRAGEAQAAAKLALEQATAELKKGTAGDAAALAAAQEKVKLTTAAAAAADKVAATAAATAKAVSDKNPAKDATFVVYSNPIRLRVKEVTKK
jgi:hypothetical protein